MKELRGSNVVNLSTKRIRAVMNYKPLKRQKFMDSYQYQKDIKINS